MWHYGTWRWVPADDPSGTLEFLADLRMYRQPMRLLVEAGHHGATGADTPTLVELPGTLDGIDQDEATLTYLPVVHATSEDINEPIRLPLRRVVAVWCER